MSDLAASTIWITVGSLLTGMAGVWLSTLSKETAPRKHNIAASLVVLGTIATATAGLFSQAEQSHSQRQLQARNDGID